MSIGKHLATFNLFREADNSIHVTIAEAKGVRDELGDSGAPLFLCAMNALRSAHELRDPKRDAAGDLYEALSALFEASRIHDPDDWTGEPAMCAAQAALAQARGEQP